MSTCPAGHQSADSDYCETCGIRMTSMPSTSTSATTVLGVVSESSTPDCPVCGERLVDRFCEGCGFDTLQARRSHQAVPPPAAPATSGWPGSTESGWPGSTESGWPGSTGSGWPGSRVDWIAVVGADRDYYERLMAETGSSPTTLPYPSYHPERQYPLTAQFVQIGRRSVGRGIRPDIDLSLPPEDPAVSHQHAVLLSKPDGAWSLVDLGATNGTLLNDNPEPVSAHIEVPLRQGDRIYLGAWTVITLRKG
ncbi:FHA domain-containing protein [Actinopolymorpha sp. B17G11]|uniref:FHA domain-containing protein n=1 Tax=Actinopolymorpha sp. B17G11 TaxID=3160861 RepID=UPI0032E40E88